MKLILDDAFAQANPHANHICKAVSSILEAYGEQVGIVSSRIVDDQKSIFAVKVRDRNTKEQVLIQYNGGTSSDKNGPTIDMQAEKPSHTLRVHFGLGANRVTHQAVLVPSALGTLDVVIQLKGQPAPINQVEASVSSYMERNLSSLT